jgi:NAD(P)-dependent dehydrogenase (short-subunit alcohol dehydrogenase family)
MNQIDLAEQIAVITGGAQGLGLAKAKRFIVSVQRSASGLKTVT